MLCKCGCGQETGVYETTHISRGYKKGDTRPYVTGHQAVGRSLAKPVEKYERPLSEVELGWIAGILEGEGTFRIQRYKRAMGYSKRIAVRVSMTDGDVIQRLKELMPDSHTFVASRKTNSGKTVYYWNLDRLWPVTDLLIAIRPLMSMRRQARIDELLACGGSYESF